MEHNRPVRDRPHLLLFGWYRPGTGFTRVLQALLPWLAQRYRVTWMGVGYRGDPQRLAEGVRLLPTNPNGGDMMGAYAARQSWRSLAPDIVLALNDPWYLEHYPRELLAVDPSAPLYGYMPLDGDVIDPSILAGLRGFAGLFTYTRHAAGELRRALAAVDLDIPVEVAGHGIDLAAFKPAACGHGLDVRMRRAQQLFDLPEPAFVVLNASRPDPRKRIDLSLELFARAAAGLPANVFLCLHQAWSFPQFVLPLREQARNLGIADRVLWWPPQSGPIADEDLDRLYNACAVGLNTSLGEGFGLVSFEHAATGAPQLLPAHPALRELWGDAALLLPVRPAVSDYSPLRLGQVDVDAAGLLLRHLHDDPQLYRQKAEAALGRCLSADLRWETSARALLRGMAPRPSLS